MRGDQLAAGAGVGAATKGAKSIVATGCASLGSSVQTAGEKIASSSEEADAEASPVHSYPPTQTPMAPQFVSGDVGVKRQGLEQLPEQVQSSSQLRKIAADGAAITPSNRTASQNAFLIHGLLSDCRLRRFL